MAADFADELRRGSDRICNLILHSELEWIDIQIEIGRLREACGAEEGNDADLFEAIYVARFRRLWEQWRLNGDTSWTRRDTPLGFLRPES